MNVAVLVCTYGSDEWRQRGLEAMRCAQTVVGNLDAHPERTVVAMHFPNGTLAQARNAAAAGASYAHPMDTYDWLCFLDADDELAPGYFDAMSKTAHHWNLWRPGDLRANPLLLAPAVSHDCGVTAELPNRHHPMTVMNHCVIGTLIPRYLFREVGGFDERWPIYEDWAMFLACIRAGARIVDVPDAVYLDCAEHGGRNTPTPVMSETYYAIRLEHERGCA